MDADTEPRLSDPTRPPGGPLDPHEHRWDQSYLGHRMTQSWADLQRWEWLLNQHPELASIVEIGTWEGGMSAYLDQQAHHRDMRFATYDINDPKAWWLAGRFIQMDVFLEATRHPFNYMPRPLIVFCDGADKPRELRTFAPLLSAGDLIAVHDWADEISSADVPGCVTMIHAAEYAASPTRVFQVG